MNIIELKIKYLNEILVIYNESIVGSTVLYDYTPRDMTFMNSWYIHKVQNDFPLIGAINTDGVLMGFATYGSFRGFPAYKFTVEHSVYVKQGFKSAGVGKALLGTIIGIAEGRGIKTVIGAIDSSNTASVGLHMSLGFSYCGTIKSVGYKMGKWLDIEFYQYILKGPVAPVECDTD